MRTVFHCNLVNGKQGDPALYVSIRHQRRAVLFDLGDIDALSSREVLALSDVFVTHCHIDHFIGFDRLLRVSLGRPTRVRMYGPAGFIDHVAGRLGGYLWNLAHRYEEGLELDVTEVEDGRARAATFRLVDGFERRDERELDLGEAMILLEGDEIRVRAAVLDHKTPCMGYVLEEKQHIGVMKNHLQDRGLPVGQWLTEVKDAVRAGAPDDTTFEPVEGRPIELGELKRECLIFAPGQRVGYVTDIGYVEPNLTRVPDLVKDVDTLYIEASFGAEDVDRAAERYHLTTAQAGSLARAAGARRVVPFHFSPRHEHEIERLEREVQEAFDGAAPGG